MALHQISVEPPEGDRARGAETSAGIGPGGIALRGGDGRRVGGIDFGFRNPFAAVWGILDTDGILWLTGEHYCRGKPLRAYRKLSRSRPLLLFHFAFSILPCFSSSSVCFGPPPLGGLMLTGLTAAEAAVGDHQATPFAVHLKAYLAHLETKGACEEHRSERNRQLQTLAAACSFALLADLRRETLERWLNAQARAGMGARTRNSYLVAAIAFANWCSEPTNGRLPGNPFDRMAKLNEKADPRRCRRKPR